MPHDLFEELVTPTVRSGSRSPYTVALSIVLHLLVIGAVVIVPLMAVDVLPTPSSAPPEYVSAVPVPPPPAAPAVPTPRPDRTTSAPAAAARVSTVPLTPPDGIGEPAPEAPPSVGPLASAEGVVGSLGRGDDLGTGTPAPPPAVPARPQRVGGLIREPQKVFHVAPVYPSIAQNARIQGVVTIEAVIGTDGTVREAIVRSGTPLLDQAALDAVRRWRYRPTTLNGVPVPVIMTVSVRFTLGR